MFKCVWLLCVVSLVNGRGLLLLYRPKDISNDCAFSHHLRYDLSFGMGMSDTITLVLRNLKEVDYECSIEIVTESVYLLIVIRFPNPIGINCAINGDAFTVLKKNKCLRICDLTAGRDTNSPYFIISVKGRIRFRFLSNSSINTDMDADYYQVTATAARRKPKTGCNNKNESICIISEDEYCFTSGVVCDGIKNCGVTDWFDERKSDCETPVERIGFAPVIAVVALILCVMLAASHLLLQYLPPLANSFFIFNANEDNRLCIDTVFKSPDLAPEIEKAKKMSLIPVSSSSSEENILFEDEQDDNITMELQRLTITSTSDPLEKSSEMDAKTCKEVRRKTAMKFMTEMLQQRLRSVVGGRRNFDPKVDGL